MVPHCCVLSSCSQSWFGGPIGDPEFLLGFHNISIPFILFALCITFFQECIVDFSRNYMIPYVRSGDENLVMY